MHETAFGLSKKLDFKVKDLDNFVNNQKLPSNMEFARPNDMGFEIERLKEKLKYYCEGYFEIKDNIIIFKKGFKEKYLGKKLDMLKDLVEDLDIKKFVSLSIECDIDEFVNDKWGLQVVDEESYFTTFDDFVRTLPSDRDQEFKIFATFDCHY